MHKKNAGTTVIGALLLVAGCNSPFQPQIDALRAIESRLKFCRSLLDQILARPPGPDTPAADLKDATNAIHAIGDELADLDKRAGYAMDEVVDAHLRDSAQPIQPAADALRGVQITAGGIAEAIDDFLASVPANLAPPEFREGLEDIQSILEQGMAVVGLGYYRHYIPIRFVQFVTRSSQVLDEQRLQYNIALANQIFFPARMRFFLREDNVISTSQFEDLYLRDANGEYILDDANNMQHEYYTWPDDLRWAPPIRGIHFPHWVSCPDFVRPAGNTETRYWAQMRAGTYCCPEGEILVYINQGKSNGGQYPWYSRIIGMTSGHMARANSNRSKFVFAHELGHYFGLPHTFPNHTRYSMDYDLAQMINCPEHGDDPPTNQRRFYTTHEHLINPETGLPAELSLFWDMFFVPTCIPGTMDTGVYQIFFDSREEAAQYEADLQPIQEWSNGRLYRKTQACCGQAAQSVKLALTVAAGCQGAEGDFSDCVCPAEDFCTGDRVVRAFSRPGSTPDTIHLNVMSYGYPMADGSDVPDGMVGMPFLSKSQLEQIERVMDPDNDVETRYFPEKYGLRPQLGSCTACHDLVGS
ncbi:MAG TPA: hypothetical protein VMZ31_11400 [Phycisphaerae bacterium]|nr:hypothetical protein [Phycisphaerae bacterium]